MHKTIYISYVFKIYFSTKLSIKNRLSIKMDTIEELNTKIIKTENKITELENELGELSLFTLIIVLSIIF